ncbi:MAG: hypothetical protein ABI863_01780 [Ginsengibacter sp.]
MVILNDQNINLTVILFLSDDLIKVRNSYNHGYRNNIEQMPGCSSIKNRFISLQATHVPEIFERIS